MKNKMVDDLQLQAFIQLNKKRKIQKKFFTILSYVFLCILALFIIIPFVQLILNSLKGPKEVEANIFFPTKWYFSNYTAVFKETVMLHSFLTTFMYIIPPVLCGTFMSSLCAYGFARLRFPGKKVIFIAMMAT